MGWLGDWIGDGFLDMLRAGILGLAAFVGDILNGIFTIDSRTTDGRPTDADLEAATSVGNLVLYLAVPLTIAAMIWQVMRSASKGRAEGVLRALVGGVAMVAGTRIVFWYGPEMVRGFDETTIALLDAFESGPGGLGTTLMEGVGLRKVGDEWQSTGGGEYEPPVWMVFSAAGGNPLGIPLILWLLMAGAALALMMMLAFRRWAVVAMIALAPLALMFLPAEKASKNMIGLWVKIFISLVAAKPLAAIILSLSAKMVSVSASMNLVMFIAAFVGLLVAAFAPVIAMKFFGFLGTEITEAYARAAGEGNLKQGAQKAGRGARSLVGVARGGGGSGHRSPKPVPNRPSGARLDGKQSRPVPNKPKHTSSSNSGSRPNPSSGPGPSTRAAPKPSPPPSHQPRPVPRQ
ncbi:hypothetical protein [Agromyces mariniharenae]|uniref:TrbL/VirB6 plasmid conjugal transfer protein n=1 Tax=Agromyces mariniharenae TaxID=2604423 RepID=A0A5S4UTZ6_9MICO|nr:hypothetical protein [Agromyces mariniharenae]TYL50417.1 hypothetical protein FYC51_14515 [Agromyces mariniharenae]